MEKYCWTLSTFDSVYWDGIGRARCRGTHTQLMHTSKLMHGWLPVNHVVGCYTGITQCPGCNKEDETLDHLFHCTHPHMVTAQTESLTSLCRFLLRAGIPRVFSDLFMHFILAYLDGTPPRTDMALAQETYQSQMAIGQNLLLRGYISIEWLHLL
jgi:hypothetical protein